jgi:hypothetical protein
LAFFAASFIDHETRSAMKVEKGAMSPPTLALSKAGFVLVGARPLYKAWAHSTFCWV